MPATGRYWPHKSGNTRIAEEEISFTRLRERCDVMANRSDREQGQPSRCPRHHSLHNRMGPCSRTPSGPAVSIDCINRPDRRLHPTNATAPIYLLQCGSHPQKTSVLTTCRDELWPSCDTGVPCADRAVSMRGWP